MKVKWNKGLSGLLAAAFLLSGLSFSAAAEKTEAKNILQGCSLISSENAASLENLWDQKVTTVWKAPAGSTLTIKSPVPIGGLYILWDRDPVGWTLSDPRETITEGGKDGFLHEYVPVSAETAFDGKYILNMTMHADASIADLYVLSPGTLPSWVQTWQPMLKKADLLAFSTHADDELLWFGGTLPLYAGQYKKKVQVAYLIYHGAARNEYFRNHELLDGLWTVGVTNYPMICRQFEDYYCSDLAEALKTYDENAMQEYAVMLLRRFKPEVVVTQDENGAAEIAEHLKKEGVTLADYGMLATFLSRLPERTRVFIDSKRTNVAIYNALPKSSILIEGTSPANHLKSIKNETEIKGFRNAVLKDGIAMTKFYFWLEKMLKAGEKVTELCKFRLVADGNVMGSVRLAPDWHFQRSLYVVHSSSGQNRTPVLYRLDDAVGNRYRDNRPVVRHRHVLLAGAKLRRLPEDIIRKGAFLRLRPLLGIGCSRLVFNLSGPLLPLDRFVDRSDFAFRRVKLRRLLFGHGAGFRVGGADKLIHCLL